jgi:hypothetical protein
MRRSIFVVAVALVAASLGLVPAAPASAAPPPGQTYLELFWNSDREDNLLCGTLGCENDQFGSGYRFIRNEGLAFDHPEPGTVPLELWYNGNRGDNADCVTDTCIDAQISSVYFLIRTEAWVYPTQQPGTVPLRMWWNSDREDNALCVTTTCNNDQVSSGGYKFLHIEGWVFPAS